MQVMDLTCFEMGYVLPTTYLRFKFVAFDCCLTAKIMLGNTLPWIASYPGNSNTPSPLYAKVTSDAHQSN